MPHLDRLTSRGDELGAALARVHGSLVGGATAEAHRAALDLGAALVGVIGSASSEDAVHALVKLASMAARVQQLEAARCLLFHVLALAVGDPHDWLFEPGGAAAFRCDASRLAAFGALESEIAILLELAMEPAAPEPADAEEGVCGIPPRPGLASTARLLCSFTTANTRAALGPDLRSRIEDEQRVWARGCALLWSDGALERAADLVARDPAEAPLVRAAAIVRAAVDDIARGDAPRAELLALLGELVVPDHRSWTDPWAPVALFAELSDRLQIALLSPAARVRFGALRPARVLDITRALVAALDVLPDQWMQRAALASSVLYFAMGARVAPWPQERIMDLVVPTPEEVSPLEREILEAVARKVSPLEWDFDVHHTLFELGLPASCGGLRRWLGLDPPGPMNTPVDVLVDGAVQTLPLDLAAQRMLVGLVDASDLAAAMARAFSPQALVHVTCEAFIGFDARHHCTGPVRDEAELRAIFDDLRFAALEARGRDVVVPVILERLDRGLDDHTLGVDSRLFVFRALARLLEAGATIPERFDVLIATLPHAYYVDPKSVREVLARLTQERNDRIFRKTDETPTFMGPREDYSDLASEEMRERVERRAKRPSSNLHKLGETIFGALESIIPKR